MNYYWRNATGLDVIPIADLANNNCSLDIEGIYVSDYTAYCRNITIGIVNSFYKPKDELFVLATNSDIILAYTWCKVDHVIWSDERVCMVQMCDIELSLPIKTRIKLVYDMIDIWEEFCNKSNIQIISSNTMRRNQHAFLKCHKKRGYVIRGSFAYKRLDTTQVTHAN